jgi:hypothetical protein
MKKLLVLVLSIVIIPLVEAVVVFGQEVSMLVLTPVILILIFLIIFIFMIIRDKIKAKQSSKAPKSSSNEALDEDLSLGDDTIAPPEDAPGNDTPAPSEDAEALDGDLLPPTEDSKSKKQKDTKGTPNSEMNYFKEIELIKKNLTEDTLEETTKKINDLIKKFFSDYAGIKYTFTFEELEKELKKRDKKVQCFSDNLCAINYSQKGATLDDIKELIGEFKDIVEATSEEKLQAIPEFKKETEEKKKKIAMLLKKGERLIQKDPSLARENYKEILEIYDTLISKEKEAIRPAILNFHDKLKGAV